jgi:WD40 repeat protein/serine/threonine protein kinase
MRNGPEDSDSAESEMAERLLEYDAALAGRSAHQTGPGDLASAVRDALSCLDMLERVRANDQKSGVCGPELVATPRHVSFSDAPTKNVNDKETRTREDIQVPARLGRFEVQRVLGQGGCGVVFLARDPALNRLVALKIPRPEVLLTPEVRQRFIREGRAAGCLDHPNLLPVFEAGEVGAICYLASAYCPGITLKDWLRQHGPSVPPRVAAELIATLADAMHYAHQKGVCHRDLKPSNVLLQISDCRLQIENRRTGMNLQWEICNLESAIPKIIDFGLAKVMDGGSGDAATRTGAVLGTPRYMAPEQAQGKTEEIGPATDIHALGVILYEMLTGATPYQGDSDLEILTQVIAVEPPGPGRLRPQVPRDLETICLRCLEKQPGRRYGSMSELAEDLQRFRDGRPIQARPSGWCARWLKRLRRRPRTAAVAALTGLSLIFLVAVLIWVSFRESAHSAHMEKALQEAALHKARAEEGDWLGRHQRYAAQIRAAWRLQTTDQLSTLREVLLADERAPDQKDLRDFAWHYLKRYGLASAKQGPITAFTYSHNAKVCAAGSRDGVIHVFDRATGRLLEKLEGHTFEISTLDFVKDDTQLVSTAFSRTSDGAGYRGEFIVWSMGAEPRILRRGGYTHPWKDFGRPMFALAPAARSLFIIDRDPVCHRLLRLDLDTGTEQELVKRETLHFVATSPQANRIAILYSHSPSSHIDTVEIIDPDTRQQLAVRQFDRLVDQAALSPDGMILAVNLPLYPTSHLMQVWDVPSMCLRKSWKFALLPQRFYFDSHGQRLAVVTDHSDFHIFDVRTGSSLRSFQRHGHDRLTFSPDGEEIALGGNGPVRAGNAAYDPLDESLPGPPLNSEAWCVAFATAGNTLSVGYDRANGPKQGRLLLWDRRTKTAEALPGHHATVMALALSPDGKTLASASYDCEVRLWDLPTRRCRRILKGHTGPVRALAFSPDGAHIASAGSDLSIKMWNMSDGALRKSWRSHKDMIRALTFSGDGKFLISAANDRTIKLWNTRDWTLTREIAAEAKIQSVVCSPDGALLASGNENNKVEIRDVAGGTLIKPLLGHSGKVRSVAFSPDGKTLASGGEDKTVRLWNVLTGQELLTFPTEHFINSLAFDSRSKTLAAALHDGTVKIWSGE